VVGGATNFNRGDDHVENASYRQEEKASGTQSTKTGTKKSTEKSTEKSTSKSTKPTKIVLKLPFESASMKWTGWPPKRTSNDDYRVLMTTGCKSYLTEHAEAMHRAQIALARLNLVCITIYREAYLLDVNE